MPLFVEIWTSRVSLSVNEIQFLIWEISTKKIECQIVHRRVLWKNIMYLVMTFNDVWKTLIKNNFTFWSEPSRPRFESEWFVSFFASFSVRHKKDLLKDFFVAGGRMRRAYACIPRFSFQLRQILVPSFLPNLSQPYVRLSAELTTAAPALL
jgi:hypothetical protein